jgi:two-component system sensor kinase
VARQSELACLDAELARTRAGESRLIVVEGQSGYGKSRLVAEFAARAAQAGLTTFEGRADRDGHTAFALFSGVAAGVVAGCQSRPDLVQQICTGLGDQLPTVIATLPELQTTLSWTEVQPPGAVAAEAQTLSALVGFLNSLGSPEHPALVILDDCQWAHDLLYRLLLRWQVAQDEQPGPTRHVQLVIAYRSEEVPQDHPLRRIVSDVRVEVGPLDHQDVRRLVESMAGPLPAQAIDTVTRLAQGSPFMAAAILNGLVEAKAIVFESQGWRVDELAIESVCSSSHAAEFLAQRLTLLGAEALQFLQAGALLGSEFPLEMAVHLTGFSSAQAWNAVNLARRRQLLWWSRNDGSCQFVHDKIREALQQLQSPAERLRFHRRAAEYLLVHAPDHHAELAMHLEASEQHTEARHHAVLAAREARSQHALELAEQQFRIALRTAHEASPETRFLIAEGLGDTLMLRGQYAEAEQQFQQAEQLAATSEARAAVCCRQGELLIKRGDMHAALERFEQGLATVGVSVPRTGLQIGLKLVHEVLLQALHTLFRRWLVHRIRRTPNPLEQLKFRLYSGFSHASWYCSQLPRLMWAHLRGMNRAEKYQPSLELAQIYSDHAPGMTLIPWHSRGLRYAERSLEIRRQLGDLWGQGQSLHFYGIVQYAAGRYNECIDACRRAVQILQRTGDYWQVHIARYQIAASMYHLGDLQGAVDEARRNHASGLLVGDEQASGIILDVWGRAWPGRIPEELLTKELQRERHDFQGAAQVQLAAGIQRLALGDLPTACKHMAAADKIVRGSGVRNQYTTPIAVWMTTALRTMAEADRSVHPQARSALLRQAERAARRAAFESRWCRNDLPQLYRERALLAALRGRPAQAQRFFERSLAIAEQSGARYEFAVTLAEQARVGLEFGWSNAETQAIEARRQLADLIPKERTTDEPRTDSARVSASLVDRFETVLKTGRRIVSALSRETICSRVEDAASRLLRADHALVMLLDDESTSQPLFSPEAAELLERVGQSGLIQTVTVSAGREHASSILCAPIHVRGNIVACLYALHGSLGNYFGPDEEKIADFLATLAGAAFENAEGFAELEMLNATLEQKVAERTNKLHERAELLVRSNKDLERTTEELRVAQRELVASTRAAEAANHAKSRFLAAISHEIRTPMNGVIGMAELMLATDLSDRQQMYVETISQSAKALLSLLNDVLDFSKIEAGKLAVERRPFNLHETIVDSVRLLSVSAWQKGLELACRIAPQVPEHTEGDAIRLRQILLNLIGNAIKFTSRGSVTISVDVDSQRRLHVAVSDTGIGIPADRAARIFEAFDQGEVSMSRRFGGTGLGLAISSELAELMGGRIRVESVVGVGSTFYVELPLDLHGTHATEEPESLIGDSGPCRVLVVTTSPADRQSHLDWLRTWNCEVRFAASTDEARLACVGPEPLDLLLVDVPGDAGVELKLLSDLSAANLLPSAGVLVLLPAGLEAAAEQVQRLQVGTPVTKPIAPRELQRLLHSLATQQLAGPSTPIQDQWVPVGGLQVLVADDSPVNQEVAAGLLELMGHAVATADCGETALELLGARDFDVVLMDVDMPRMDGITATRRWREQEAVRGERVRIFGMSAHIAEEVRRDCLDAGMDGFLSKPVDPHQIRTTLDQVADDLRLAGRHTLEPANQAD